jgi:hypothetical protein
MCNTTMRWSRAGGLGHAMFPNANVPQRKYSLCKNGARSIHLAAARVRRLVVIFTPPPTLTNIARSVSAD